MGFVFVFDGGRVEMISLYILVTCGFFFQALKMDTLFLELTVIVGYLVWSPVYGKGKQYNLFLI